MTAVWIVCVVAFAATLVRWLCHLVGQAWTKWHRAREQARIDAEFWPLVAPLFPGAPRAVRDREEPS